MLADSFDYIDLSTEIAAVNLGKLEPDLAVKNSLGWIVNLSDNPNSAIGRNRRVALRARLSSFRFRVHDGVDSDPILSHVPEVKFLRDWLKVLRIERRSLRPSDIAKLLWSGKVSRFDRDRRLQVCKNCPVFDTELQRCGPTGIPIGCRCWMPVKTWFKSAQCWGDQNVPNFQHGWNAHRLSTGSEIQSSSDT